MRVLVLATITVAMMCGCKEGHREEGGAFEQPNTSHISDEQTERPYLQLNEQQTRAFVAKVEKVKIGDSRLQIEAALGTPWSDQVQQKKDTSHAFVGRSVVYYVRKQVQDMDNERLDQWVDFWFDKDDRLREIYAQNIEGIKNQP